MGFFGFSSFTEVQGIKFKNGMVFDLTTLLSKIRTVNKL